MNKQIIEAIERSVAENNIQHLTLWLCASDEWIKLANSFGASSCSIELAQLIENEHPKLSSSFFSVGGRGERINAMYLAKWLVLRASLVGAEIAYSSLLALESSSEYTAYNLSLISGIDFRGKIELVDDIYFCDGINLPEEIKVNVDSIFERLTRRNSFSSEIHPPYTFLFQPIKINLLSNEFKNETRETMINYVNKEMLISNFLSLFSNNSAPCVELRWCILEDSTPLSGIIDTGFTNYLDVIKPKHYDVWTDIDTAYVRGLFLKYLAIEEKRRLPLDISLARRCQAMNTWNNVNKAIDLGIALESILTKPSNNGELTLQIRIIGSKLISSDISRRKEISSLLKTIYNIRSSAVHEGFLKEKYSVCDRGKLNAGVILEEGFPVLRDCLVKIIEHGGLTDDDYEELFFS
ncbi:hypothetical protein HUO09_21635 [Vibrio sp. Y2-5]|uniref:HEPN domain-containing protein n=1 Tax=Vibrio sp. Y2-5 TaxID=2743977 RepID=UPI0016613F40|nr:HEPN domain-containing protein [Vibrio sp. Y2-5]MBD0788928.1 hypothetical protein [Vibrio sp. Y2-5]